MDKMLEKQIQMVDLRKQYERLRSEINPAMQTVIDACAFINGPQVKEFCNHLSGYLGVPYVIPCGNGTDALQISLMALDLHPGDEVIVPPYWVHATISANPRLPLTFGAWCDRDYGFVYEGVRKHRGIAWFPVFNGSDELEWIANSMYDSSHLICKSPSDYISLDIRKGVSIYRQFEENPEIFLYVPNPALKAEVWRDFEP